MSIKYRIYFRFHGLTNVFLCWFVFKNLTNNYFYFLGFPAPVYKWYKDGKEVGDFSSEYQSFRLLNLKQNDGGTYQCIAKNDVGSILSQKIEINIACKY